VSRDRQQYRVELETSSGATTQELPYEEWTIDDTPFRIGLLGDFTGRANRGLVETGRALAARRPLRIDRDNVDDLITRLAPELNLSFGDAGAAIKFAELDDFRPDRLYERLPAFRGLREARERAAAPVPLGDIGRQGGRTSTGRAAPASGNLLDQILGDVPAPPGGAAAEPPRSEPMRAIRGDALTDFVRRAVAPHAVPETAPAQPDRLKEIDRIVGDDLRAVLHQPDFQALESAWRAVDFLVRRLETDAMLQIYLIDVSKAELTADLARANGAQSGIHRLLVEASVGTAGGTPWALLVGLYSFGPDGEDVDLLRRLAAVARAAGAPMIAAAESHIVGSPSFGSAPDPDDWRDEETPEWDALRRSADARYVGLAAPRFLLRLPYGAPDGEPCDVPGFQELSAPAAHDEYLWGNSAVLTALLHGEAFASDGWSLRPGLDVAGLPFHLVRSGGDVTAKPCAEAVLSARAVDRMLERGVMPVQSMKDGDAVRLARLQSIAKPLAALALRDGRADADG
jgi:type VI secretion system protein ImpC